MGGIGTRGATSRAGARWRCAGPIVGTVAAALLVVVGCTRVSGGAATVDRVEAAQYRTSVSESAAASRVAEASRRTCDEVFDDDDAFAALGDFLEAARVGILPVALVRAAAGELNDWADRVQDSMSDDLDPDFAASTEEWIDTTRDFADAIDGFNANMLNLGDRFAIAVEELQSDCEII